MLQKVILNNKTSVYLKQSHVKAINAATNKQHPPGAAVKLPPLPPIHSYWLKTTCHVTHSAPNTEAKFTSSRPELKPYIRRHLQNNVKLCPCHLSFS